MRPPIQIRVFAALFVSWLLLAGCSSPDVQIEGVKGRTMGTTYSLLWPANQDVDAQRVREKVELALASINAEMSTYDPSSQLSQFNKQSSPSSLSIGSDFYQVMVLSKSVFEQTDGYFDPTVGPLVNLWGFGPDKHPINIPSASTIADTKMNTGFSAIQLDEGVIRKNAPRYVDLSAVAKGFAVDKVALILDDFGISSYLVEIGGELKGKGLKAPGLPWKVAVEKPIEEERAVQEVLPLTNGAMATSGDYRNYFVLEGKKLSHSIDPFTGYPVEHTLASVTVVDDNCARADALATAMLVMGAEKAKKLAKEEQIAALLIERVGTDFITHKTPAWTGRFEDVER